MKGRQANRPGEIPGKGWLEIGQRIKTRLTDTNVPLLAAGVAFYSFLAIAPALVALVGFYGLFAEPASLQDHFAKLRGLLPAEAYEVVTGQMERIAAKDKAAGWGAAFGLIFALWSGSKGTKGLIQCMNVVYRETERRGGIRFHLLALAMTLGAVVVVGVGAGIVALLPIILDYIGLEGWGKRLVEWLRWPLLVAFFLTGLAAVYRYGPSRRNAKWRWISWGAGLATVLWMAGSVGFSLYVSNFGKYDEVYGSLGAVVVLLLWLFLTCFVVILGGVINAEMEHQTVRDSTVGSAKPRGERGAYVADHIPTERS